MFRAALGLACLVPIAAFAQDIRYGTGNWNADELGNQRAVVRVRNSAPDAVLAHLPWRRRDLAPEKKEVVITDGRGARVRNVVRLDINREYGDLIFQPISGAGDYYVYYLPYTGNVKANYPKIVYPAAESTAEPDWLARHGLAEIPSGARSEKFTPAELVEFQSVDEFDSPYPMELIATRQEVEELLAKFPQHPYFVFPEDRKNPIRMTRDLQSAWIRWEPGAALHGAAQPGEYYVFQLGIWAARTELKDVSVAFTPLRAASPGRAIPSAAFLCLNLNGVDLQGRDFTRAVTVAEGNIQATWCGIEIPDDAAPGEYSGELEVAASGQQAARVPLELTVAGKRIRNHGDDEPARLSRLRWLNSRLAEDDGIVAPYERVTVNGHSIRVLGRRMSLGPAGFPASVQSYFDVEMTHLSEQPREVLAAPIALVIEDKAGRTLSWTRSDLKFTKRAEGVAAWEATSKASGLEMLVRGQAEFDGYVDFNVVVRATQNQQLNDIRLEIPISSDVAHYLMGFGLKGEARPQTFDWKWDAKHNQDGAWIGDVNAGLQFGLRDDRYVRPLNTNFYLSQPLLMPASWDNHGQGGCRLAERDGHVYLVTCYSGPRLLAAGEVQHYDFHLLLTPFHTLDTNAQWNTRFYHAFRPIDEIAATGANTINVHHATAINPFINYPFLRPQEMKAYVDSAHARGMKVKIYYTVRELTNHAPELFALRSLGDEVIARGPGGGPPWLQEHLEENYIPGWYVPELRDAAVINTGTSRWHNFYVEGMRWLVENVGIDGIYLDDVAFDRTTMKRIRKVLLRGRPGSLIDLHSANQFNPRDGYANSANLYLEHFPYIDRLWFGEYFDYNSPPAYWLTEISGIPFGLMGEMLQDGGNPWRGMVFGMTSRLPWSGNPQALWREWDTFGMLNSRMIGFWVPSSPVQTGREDILATVYQRQGKALVSVASWAKDPVDLMLAINWHALGIDPAHAGITAPAIEKFQEAASFAPGQAIPVAPGKGWLLVLESRR